MKKIIKLLSIAALAACALWSCDPMDASIQEFLDGGEAVVYLGKVTGVKAYPGKNEARITWNASSDSRIKGAIIYWNSRQQKLEVSWNPAEKFETVIEGLSEGSVIFEIVTIDGKGNTSVPVSVSGKVYGDQFNALIDDTAGITSGFFNETTHAVDLSFKHSNNIYYRSLAVTYKLLPDQRDTTVFIPKDSLAVTLDQVASPEIFYKGTFAPEENCIDYYFSESHRYEDLFNPYCAVTSEAPVLAYMTGAAGSVTFEANRAPVTVVLPDGCWADAEVDGMTVVFTAKSDNGKTENRSFTAKLKAGTFEENIVVTQTKDRRGTAYGQEGVIFWQNKDNPKEYKIISAKRGDCMWSTESKLLGVNKGTYQSAGTAANMAKWLSITGYTEINGVLTNNNDVIGAEPLENYPAYKWCKDLGEGWYLPAGLELREVFAAYNGKDFDAATAATPNKITAEEQASRNAFDTLLESLEDGVKLNTQAASAAGDWVWSNMEETAAKACGFRFGNRGFGSRAKTTNGSTSDKFYTRAVKVVTIDE